MQDEFKLRMANADYVFTKPRTCPMCNQAWPGIIAIIISEEHQLAMIGKEHRRCPPKAARFLSVLARDYGRFITAENLIWMAYSDMPDDAQPGIEAVGSGITAARAVLEGTEYFVQSTTGRGYRLIRYQDAMRGLTPSERAVYTRHVTVKAPQLRIIAAEARKARRDIRAGKRKRKTSKH